MTRDHQAPPLPTVGDILYDRVRRGDTIPQEDQEMAVNEFSDAQLWDIARRANGATGAEELTSDYSSVDSFLLWASESRVPDMTPWQRAAWERIQQLRAEASEPQSHSAVGEPAAALNRNAIEQRIREIRERVANASPGPWRRGHVELYHVFCKHPEGLAGPVLGERVILRMNEHFPYLDDVSFIANARQDLPDLCNAVEALLARVEELEKAGTEALDGWEECCEYKMDCLVKKHGDREDIARLRGIVKGDVHYDGTHSHWMTQFRSSLRAIQVAGYDDMQWCTLHVVVEDAAIRASTGDSKTEVDAAVRLPLLSGFTFLLALTELP
jgi:hypothetical protein